MFASLPQQGGGLAGRLAGLGQAAGMALTGIGQKPETDTPEMQTAEKRHILLKDIMSSDEENRFLEGSKTLAEGGDLEGSVELYKMHVSTLKKKTKPKTLIKGIEVAGGTQQTAVTLDAQGNVIKEVPIGGIKKERPRSLKVSKTDIERVTNQANNVYKGMDFKSEDNPDFDHMKDLVAGKVNEILDERQMNKSPSNQIKITREVLKGLEKSGGIYKDENFAGFVEPKIDTTKMETFFGITGTKTTDGGLSEDELKELKALEAKFGK